MPMPNNLASLTLKRSLELLLLSGISFFEELLPPKNGDAPGSIALKVGSTVLTHADVSEAAIEAAIQASGVGERLGDPRRAELDRVNNQITSKSERRNILERMVDRGSTLLEKGNALAEIEELAKEIKALQLKLWAILQSTGAISASRRFREPFESEEILEFVSSAKSQATSDMFLKWAGSARPTLAIVFTDIVGSTALGESLKDETMRAVRAAHFAQSRKLIGTYKGFEIKTIGDSFMVVFKAADEALDYAMELSTNTGEPRVQIRAGIHIGSLDVEDSDVFGGEVNFAARVVGAVKGAELWISDELKKNLDRLGAARHAGLKWERNDGLEMKGFDSTHTLWSLKRTGAKG